MKVNWNWKHYNVTAFSDILSVSIITKHFII